jgi:uncharacterized membrane protein
MTPFIHQFVLLLHLLAAIFWLGGMATILFCVRPAALALLSPPQPIAMMHATLARFLKYVALAMAILLLTGIHLYGLRGGLGARWGVHTMAFGGIVMMLIYGHLRFTAFKKLDAAVKAQTWPEGKAALDQIRLLVQLNLIIGVGIVAAVKLGA